MACRGVHFALSGDDVDRLRGLPEARRPRYVSDVIEEAFFAERAADVAETDKAWDAIHRALTDGHLRFAGSPGPLGLVVLGGQQLYGGPDHVLSLKTPRQVRDVAPHLTAITHPEFRRRYFEIDATEYERQPDEADCGYA